MKMLDCSFIIKDKKNSPYLFEEFEDKRPRKKNIVITNNTANDISMPLILSWKETTLYEVTKSLCMVSMEQNDH